MNITLTDYKTLTVAFNNAEGKFSVDQLEWVLKCFWKIEDVLHNTFPQRWIWQRGSTTRLGFQTGNSIF